MSKVCVIGGGASGMMASISSAMKGNQVFLFEKNEKLGKKVYITGKGRCNITNDCDDETFFNNVVRNYKFLFSAYNNFPSKKVQDFFSDNGLQLKVERGNRVFPFSDKSSDVIKTFEKKLNELNVKINLNSNVEQIIVSDNVIKGIICNGKKYDFDSVIICTGGISYPLTGSTGDGYIFAKKCGHNIIDTKAGLSAIILKGSDFASLQGLSLKNVQLNTFEGEKLIFSEFGEMLFTHFGISGPIVLTTSSIINRKDFNNLTVSIDLKPALDEKTLDNRLLREFDENNRKEISSVMRSLVPSTLVDIILRRSFINGSIKCANISKEQRKTIINSLKNFIFKVKGLCPIDEAIITSGGIDVKQINPKTMESKIVKGLFFAGEVIDVDAYTGGFNLQIAFSTGYLAGQNS